MAKEIRKIVASETVAPIIDKGGEIDSQIKALTEQDKSVKAQIIETVAKQIRETEVSVKVLGIKSSATVTAAERYTFNMATPEFSDIKKAVESGLLQNVVDRKLELAVSEANVEKAVEILKANGIMASSLVSWSVNPEKYRDFTQSESASLEENKLRQSLKKCLVKEVNHRVKYGTV